MNNWFKLFKEKLTKKHKLRGFLSTEFVLTLAIITPILVGMLYLADQYQRQTLAITAGQTTYRVKKAVDRYITANYQAVEEFINIAGGPVRIDMFTLCSAGFMDEPYCDTSGATTEVYNAFGQSHDVLVYANARGNLIALTVARGVGVNRIDIGNAAGQMQDAGGLVTTTECLLNPSPCVKGIKGIWDLPIANFDGALTNAFLPTDGHLAAISFFGEGTAISPYLHRMDIGNPEANRMATNIDMGNNQIVNANDICITSRDMCLSEIANSTYTVGHGAIVDKPICPVQAPNPKIFVSQQIFFDSGEGFPINGAAAYAVDNPVNDSQWIINITVRTQSGTSSPAVNQGRALIEVRCLNA